MNLYLGHISQHKVSILNRTLTRWPTHSHTHTLTQSITHSLTHLLNHSLTHSHIKYKSITGSSLSLAIYQQNRVSLRMLKCSRTLSNIYTKLDARITGSLSINRPILDIVEISNPANYYHTEYLNLCGYFNVLSTFFVHILHLRTEVGQTNRMQGHINC